MTSQSRATRPLISIVTVTRNAVATLEATIRSVLQQSYKNVEYLIIDGGSTDGTLDIIRQYEHRIGRWVSEPDGGIYDAMNKGAVSASGEWILFLNSGDTFCGPDVLRSIFEREDVREADVLYGDAVHKRSGNVLRAPAEVDRGYFYFETLCHQSVFARRGLFDRAGGFGSRYRIIADREWLFRALLAGARFAYVATKVSVWDSDGFSSANAALSQREVLEFQTAHFSRRERFLLPWRMRLKSLRGKLGHRLHRSDRELHTADG